MANKKSFHSLALLLMLASGCADDVVPTDGSGGSAATGGSAGIAGAGGDDGCALEESCDGIDNDCDAEIDEGCACAAGDTQPCYSGDPATEGVGACLAGEQICDDQGAWGACTGEVTPLEEACDALDNDCDGSEDEGFGSVTCGLGICQVTVDECVDGTPTPCVPNAPNPNGESCDGADDDCDGDVDEGCSCLDGQMQSCYTGAPGTLNVGECKPGTQSCSGGQWAACTGDTTPSTEQCDGLDNDCDGQSDEGDPGGGAACNTGQPGVCAAGIEHCQSGQIACQQVTPSGAEQCNGLDDDCDGMSDEGNPGGGGLCNTGQLGLCAAGTFQCQGGMLVCTPTTTPVAESCDGLDNDCDGMSDEGNPGGGGACTTGQLGVCAPGTLSCQGGSLSCSPNAMPGAEVCDGLDNDCDGATDESNPGGGVSCNTGQPGNCAAGTTNCQGGTLVCTPNNGSSTEVCNGSDDDCDGMTDEGNPGGGSSCSTGQPGVCAAGTTVCQGGSLACAPNNAPSSEQCNGSDDDCDGQSDEGNPGGGMSCSTGQAGVCAAGTTACQGGSIQCTPNNMPTSEQCNGSDDDCDGQTDEGNPGGGASCNTGQPGICAQGVTQCQSGSLACAATNSPQTESCGDNLDNDCDGQTDESCGNCNQNLALSATGSQSGGGSGGYGPGNWNDGTTEAMCASACGSGCFGWVSNGTAADGKWVQYQWSSPVTIGSMYVDANACAGTCTGPGRTMYGGDVQWWNGSAWITAQSFTGNDGDRAFNFSPPITTTQIRIFNIRAASCGQPSNTEIFEWYVWSGNNCTP